MLDPKNLNLDALYFRKHNDKHLLINEIHSQCPPYFGFVPLGKSNIYMLLCGKDDGVALKLFYNKTYEATSLCLWRLITARCDTAIDVGAHTGIYSLVAALNKTLTIASVEPVACNLNRLINNIRYNQIQNVTPLLAACSNTNGKASLKSGTSLDYLTSGAKILPEDEADSCISQIPSITIDQLLSNSPSRRIAIKLDIEGHEFNALQGALNTISQLRPSFIIECTNAQASRDCSELLSQQGYIFFLIEELECRVSQTDRLFPSLKQETLDMNRLNRLAIPKEQQAYFEQNVFGALRHSLLF